MTPFQSECYKALEKVPPGKVISYAGLAEMIGRPKAHRAVGSAMNEKTLLRLKYLVTEW